MIKQVENKVFTSNTISKILSFIPHLNEEDYKAIIADITDGECIDEVTTKVDQFSTYLIYHLNQLKKRKVQSKPIEKQSEYSIDKCFLDEFSKDAVRSKTAVADYLNMNVRNIFNWCEKDVSFTHTSQGIHILSFIQWLKDFKPKYYNKLLNIKKEMI